MKVTRINPGIYDVATATMNYELERYPDGNWLLFIATSDDLSPRIYCNDFVTKRAALQAIEDISRDETAPTIATLFS